MTDRDSLNFKVGDIIIAYKKGYHECISITDRWFIKVQSDYVTTAPGPNVDCHYAPIVEYVQLYTAAGKPTNAKRKIDRCDGSFCKLAKEVAKQLLDEAQHVYDLLK